MFAPTNPKVRVQVARTIDRIVKAEVEVAGADEVPIVKQYGRIPMTPMVRRRRILSASFHKHFGEALWKMDPDTGTEKWDNLASLYNILYIC